MKITAKAPSNIAFIKYWGKKDSVLKLPLNSSISVNLSGLSTTTTVEFSSSYSSDTVSINNRTKGKEVEKIISHLDLIRKIAGIKNFAKVKSVNNFETASGLASSASGFAALTAAASKAASLNLTEKELTIIARQGSGSACRSIPDGWVEWKGSYAQTIFPISHWDINIITVVVDKKEKDVLTTEAMESALSNPHLKTRLYDINKKISNIKKIIAQKKFTEFGELIEKEALELHAITMTSDPPIIYWEPVTVKIIKLIWQLRKTGLECYFTIDAGPHLKVICENKNKNELIKKLNSVEGVVKIITNKVAGGTRIINNHLF